MQCNPFTKFKWCNKGKNQDTVAAPLSGTSCNPGPFKLLKPGIFIKFNETPI